MRASPYGVTYDFYAGRAFIRLAGYTVLGSGDDCFCWGNNNILPAPAGWSHEPGTHYCDANTTNYLFNTYGRGNTGWDLGIDFAYSTTVQSLDFGYASGSNAPTHAVWIDGYLGGALQWSTAPAAVAYGSLTTLGTPSAAVDRIEIWRDQNPAWPRVGWYTLDNLTFDATGEYGGYDWTTGETCKYASVMVPEPLTVLGVFAGLAGLGGYIRRRRQA